MGKENCRSLGCARDDKGDGGAHLSSCYKGLREPYAEREANDPSIHTTNCRGKEQIGPLSSRANPNFLPRCTGHSRVCGFP